MPSAAAVPSRPGYKLIFRAFITLEERQEALRLCRWAESLADLDS